jgi:Mlc titration factor MtfA (ptsG expression regulator)
MIPLILLISVGIFAFYFFWSRQKTNTANNTVIKTALLATNVLFYAKLSDADKTAFENDMQYFLSHVKITGVDTSVEELDTMLIAAAAVVPVFHFKEWRYQNLQEVLLYSDAINMDFETSGNADRNILGMVGTGAFEGKLLLSKQSLHEGFSNKTDKLNTAVHEFVHLIDKSDGDTDGVPNLLLDKQFVLPWLNLMHEQMQQIAKGQSDINPYGFTNKAEFFAVASEYFFEQPELLEEKHPELYQMLNVIFTPPAQKAV